MTYTLNMNDCLFCKIIKGEVSSAKVYEDENSFAFLDIMPNNPGHTLIVPKKHFNDIFDTPNEELCKITETVKKVSEAINAAIEPDGINIAMNNKAAAGQVIFHAHIHIIPRYKDDGYKPWPGKKYKDGEEKEVAEKIKSQL